MRVENRPVSTLANTSAAAANKGTFTKSIQDYGQDATTGPEPSEPGKNAMFPLQRLLVATDLSAPARHAAKRAALVGAETSAALDLLHVANLVPLERLRQLMAATSDEMQARVLETARGKLQELADSLSQRHGVSAHAHVAAGSLLAELARHAEEQAAGLVVCGARGESFLWHAVLGTTAQRILNATKRPVLVVRQAPHEPYRRVLVAVDFSHASLRAIEHARVIAPNAEIVLLHAFEVPFEGRLRYASVDADTIERYRLVVRQEAIQALHALRDEAGLSPAAASSIVLHGDPAARICEQEQERDCDLIVIGKQGQGAIAQLLLGSVTRHVLAGCQSDVLVSA